MRKTMMNKIKSLAIIIVVGIFVGSIQVSAATFSEINSSNVFLKQNVSGDSGTCTLSSVAMLLRRAALLNGNGNWSGITESSIKSTAWTSDGLINTFSYAGINVSSKKISSNKTQTFIDLLNSHPEGIVIYDFGKPHAILLTDYTNGVFYCADPSTGAPSGRIPVSQATITVESADKYWYVTSPSFGLTTDTAAPTVTDIKIVNPTATGYTITCKVTDASGVSNVRFASWSTANGQDDVWWNEGVALGGGVYACEIKRSDHNNEPGMYETHIYAYDTQGNYGFGGGVSITLEENVPTVTDIQIAKQSVDGYTITCKAADESGISKVDFASWTSVNGQDDVWWTEGSYLGEGVYSCDVKFSDHNGEKGVYETHIYAYDTLGNFGPGGSISITLEETVPTVTDIKITNQSVDGYTITCKATDVSGISRVRFASWTSVNGQDDVWWTEGVHLGGGVYSCEVKRSDHNQELGKYENHIYAYDVWENKGFGQAPNVYLEKVAPTVKNLKVVSQTADGYKVTCTVVDEQNAIDRVQFPTWTKENGQDDLDGTWFSGSKCSGKYLGNNVYSFEVKRSEHNNEYGLYYTDVYAFDALGNMCFGGEVTVELQPQKETVNTPAESPSDSSDNKLVPPAVGTIMNYKGLRYKVMKNGSGAYMQCIGPVSKYITNATIYGSLKITNKTGSFNYPITQIKNSAFKNCTKLKKIQIGSQIKTIGKYAFYNCKKLKSITIKSKQISKINKNAFKGIYKKAKIIVPASKRSKYKKMIRKAGAKSTVKFK